MLLKMKNIQYKIFCCLVFCLGLGLASVSAQGVCDDPSIPVNDGWNSPNPNGDGFSVRQGTQSGRIFRNGVPSACPSKPCPGNFNQVRCTTGVPSCIKIHQVCLYVLQ